MLGTPAKNRRVAREHFVGLFNQGDAHHEVLADGFRIHANSHEPRTVEEQRRAIAVYREGFPDLTVSVEDAFATEDRAVLRTTMTGTHQGALFGLGPTGTGVEIPAIAVYHIADGLLSEAWYVANTAGLKEQVQPATDSPD